MDERQKITKLNEDIGEKFSRIETSISSSSDIQELYEKLLQAMTEEFTIPYIWFSFVHSRRTLQIIKRLESSELLKYRLNMIAVSTFEDLMNNKKQPILVNADLKPFYKLLPKSNKYFLKSLAVAPITLNGTYVGSLNFGDSIPHRYSPDMDTELLGGLANKFSGLLSEIIADKRQDSSGDKSHSEM